MATTTDPNAVTWNPDGTFNKGGKTYRNQYMTPMDYMGTLAQTAAKTHVNPHSLPGYDELLNYNHPAGGGNPNSTMGSGGNPQQLHQYAVELPNYAGSTAATPPTGPTTPTTPTTTVKKPTVDPRTAAINAAVAKGGTELTRLLTNKGITNDTYGITADFNRLLADAGNAVPKGADFKAANTPSYYNYEDIFNKAYTTATDRGRNTAQQQLNTLTPAGWEQNYFADTADDPILQQILGQQYNETQGNLQRQLERGQISQGAYDYALGQLGSVSDPSAYSGLASSAYQTLQGIGGGVLGGYRTGLDTTEQAIQNAVTNYSIGQELNPGGNYWQNQLDTQAQGYRGGMEGDIRRAIGNTQLFDPYSLVSHAGSVTGPSNNPLTGNVAQGQGSVLQNEEDRRTQGTSGVF